MCVWFVCVCSCVVYLLREIAKRTGNARDPKIVELKALCHPVGGKAEEVDTVGTGDEMADPVEGDELPDYPSAYTEDDEDEEEEGEEEEAVKSEEEFDMDAFLKTADPVALLAALKAEMGKPALDVDTVMNTVDPDSLLEAIMRNSQGGSTPPCPLKHLHSHPHTHAQSNVTRTPSHPIQLAHLLTLVPVHTSPHGPHRPPKPHTLHTPHTRTH